MIKRLAFSFAVVLALAGASCAGFRVRSPIAGGPRPAPAGSTSPVLSPVQDVFSRYRTSLNLAVESRLTFLRAVGIAKRHNLIGEQTVRKLERAGDVARVAIDQAIDALTTYLSISDPTFPDKNRLLWAITQVNQTMLNLQLELAKEGLIK